MNIFDVVDLAGMTIQNTDNKFYTILGKFIKPGEPAKTLAQLGINFCEFKELYRDDELLQSWFDDGLLISTPITSPGSGGIICPFEAIGGSSGTLPPVNPQPGDTWVKLPNSTLFIWDDTRGKWLGNEFQYSVGRGFGMAQNLALFGIDGTPTSQTPIRIAKTETLVGIILESESTTTWTAQVRDFASKVAIPGAQATVNGAKSSYTSNLNIDFTAGQEVEIYLSSGSGISFPRVTLITKERGN